MKIILMVNGIWERWYHPANCEKIREKISKCNQYDFLHVLLKSSWTTFKTIFETLSAPGPVTWPLLEGWYARNPWFFENISASFWYIFMKSFLIASSYRVLVINIKSLIMGPLVILKTRLKVLIWFFWPFGHFLSCLFWHKPVA